MAEKVLRMTGSDIPFRAPALSGSARLVQRKCGACQEDDAKHSAAPLVQRKCGKCQKEDEDAPAELPLVQRAAAEGSLAAARAPAAPIPPFNGSKPATSGPRQAAALGARGSGQPLSPVLREFFEPRFGHDFSHVRVHTDHHAAQAARSLNARAFTSGHDIVFAEGEYSAQTTSGRRLLAHELTHVVQQGSRARGAGGGVVQRQEHPRQGATSPALRISLNVSSDKWSTNVESAYRTAGLVRQADAVRACRERGLCQQLLTEAEAWEMYQSGRDVAGLGSPSAEAGAPLVAGALSSAARSAPAVGEAVGRTALQRASAAWATEATVMSGGAAAEGGAAAAGASVASVAVPVVIGIVVVVALVDLFSWGSFQSELMRQGYLILPSPLGVCIGSCHAPRAPRAEPVVPFRDFPDFPRPRAPSPPTPWPIGPGSLSEADRRRLEEWLQPTPSPGELPVSPGPSLPLPQREEPAPARPPVEASNRRHPRREPRPVQPIDVSLDPDHEEGRRRNPCAADFPDMMECSNLGTQFTHDDFQSAFEAVMRELGPRALRPNGSRQTFTSTRGVERSTRVSYGRHQTWHSEDGHIKFSIGCTQCCQNIAVGTAADGGTLLSAVPGERCGVLNIVTK